MPSPIWEQRPCRSEQVVVRNIGDETILVPISGSLADLEQVFVLNALGLFVWERLDGSRSVAAIVDEVLEEFDASRETAEQDVAEFVENLSGLGVLAAVGSSE
jgi:hypothetical protein